MNLGEFIDTYKEAIAQRVVESYPPLYRPSENGGTLPRLLRTPLGAQTDAIRGAALSLEAHRGTTVVGEMGTGKDVHRRGGGAHGGLPEDSGALPAAPGSQVEAGGGADGAQRTRRHRRVHHRPGKAALLHRLRPAVRGDVPGEGEAVLPLAGRRHPAVGNLQGQAGAGGGDGRAVPGSLLPRLHGADHGQGRGAPDRRRPEPQAARLLLLRLPPLAGGQVRPEEVSARRLREAPHEGLLRPADYGRSSRVQGARLGPGHRGGRPRRRLRQVPLPERHPYGRLQLDAVSLALPVLT